MPAREPSLPPLPSPNIIGRDDELKGLIAAVTGRSAPVLTILGPGGVGKTRLALTAAWELIDSFEDGVVFVPLINETPGEIWETVARTLGITKPPDDSWIETLGQALASCNMLLIFDDCEHVCEAFSALPAILAQCPDVVVLATSQHPLQLEIEQELWLRPLSLPRALSNPRQIETSAAVQLFALRARRRNPDFIIDDSNAADIAAIVRLLDGLPLAIELAAGQTRHFTPAELRHQLERSLPSLASGARDLPERHRSLLNMTTWSLNLLSPEDRRRFLRLSVLRSDFTPDTAFRMMGIPEVEGWELLIDLADKSLITRAPANIGQSSAIPRFFILQTLQAGARHLLQQDPNEYSQALLTHADIYLALARRAARDWHGPRYIAAFEMIDREYQNIEAIIEAALTTPDLVERAIELADPMYWYWLTRNRESWILPRLETILANAPDSIGEHRRGVAHIAAGWFAIRQNHTHCAGWHFREGARLIADPADPAALRGAMGQSYVLRNVENDKDGSIAMLRETIDLAKSRPDAWFERSSAHFSLAINLYFNGEATDARTHLSEALKIARTHEDSQSIAMNLIYLAQTDRLATQYTDALHKIQEALPILETGGDISNILRGLDIAIMVVERMGDSVFANTLAASNQRLRQAWHIQRLSEEQEIINATLRRLQGSTGDSSDLLPDTMPSLGRLVSDVVAWRPEADPAPASPPSSPLDGILSDRELEILYMVADGKTSPQIAAELFVSPHTVKRHMANIRAKLGVRSQAAAVAMLQRDR